MIKYIIPVFSLFLRDFSPSVTQTSQCMVSSIAEWQYHGYHEQHINVVSYHSSLITKTNKQTNNYQDRLCVPVKKNKNNLSKMFLKDFLTLKNWPQVLVGLCC